LNSGIIKLEKYLPTNLKEQILQFIKDNLHFITLVTGGMCCFVCFDINLKIPDMTTTTLETLNSTENRRAFPGIIFNVVIPGTVTSNSMFIAEVEGLPGGEPPRHVHTREDEIVIIKEGTITYFIGDDIISAKPGDTVVLPKNIPHHFVITSEKMKVTLITTSASFGDFFCRLSMPYNDREIPAPQRLSDQRKKEMKALSDEFGIYYV